MTEPWKETAPGFFEKTDIQLATKISLSFFAAIMLILSSCGPARARTRPNQPPQGQAAAAKPIGTIKAISGNAITLTSDAGPTFSIQVQDSTRIVRIEPGEKDLKNATPEQLQDLQIGDRILVLGKVSEDGHTVAASSVVVMKKSDVVSKQEQDRQDWQKRGVGGLVSAVDPSTGMVTISVTATGGSKTIMIRVSKSTVVRRYAPESVKFDDAKPSSLDQIKPGDQVLARGSRNADGSEVAAEEVVSGAFRNIAGTISSIDPSANTVNVMDLGTKRPVLVKITSQSQLRKLTPQMAQVMAGRLKGAQPGASSSGAGSGGNAESPASGNPPSGSSGGSPSAAGGRRGPGGGGDLQQMLTRIPPASLADLQKGDAVMIVSTEGTASGAVTAITLLSGVEPLLAASSGNGSQPMVLPPWSLDAAPGGDSGGGGGGQ